MKRHPTPKNRSRNYYQRKKLAVRILLTVIALSMALLFLLVGLFPAIRYLFFFFRGDRDGHIQSLIFASIFIMISVMLAVFGLLADMISTNRKVVDEVLYRVKKLEYEREAGAQDKERAKK